MENNAKPLPQIFDDGKCRVTLSMPESGAQKLAKGFAEKDPTLMAILAEFGGVSEIKVI